MGLPGAAACSMALLRVLILSMGLTLESLQTLERAAQRARSAKRCAPQGLRGDHCRRHPNGHGGLERDTGNSEHSASMFDTLSLSD